MTPEVDIAVVGAGLMGSATAWAATRRGHSVALVERFEPGHHYGNAHVSARIFRRSYPDPLYADLSGRAMELWCEAEHDTGAMLLRMTGGLDHGRGRDPGRLAKVLAGGGIPYELMTAAEAERQWPGLKFDRGVVYHPGAGTIDTVGAVAAFVARAAARGADVRTGEAVRRIVPLAPDRVRVETDEGRLVARRVVVAAGAWTAGVLGDLVTLPPLRVTQERVFHFARRPGVAEWPVVVHKDTVSAYHLPSGRDGGPGGARKVAEHRTGPVTTPDARSGQSDPVARGRVSAYVERWMPGLDPEPIAETTCLYTSTPSDDFVLDRVGPIVVCSPCSGHGAKFAPLVGEFATDLATGQPAADTRFTLAAHARATAA